ncbi:ABC-type transport auxiliary lipoprotein family protein [Undibacterium griseum]|uniref:Membrane integrity-associated transporter subunit PqiC n=1 Tax=Undibacterium griseum TaxID=2762295 RepID=A0ABR6YJF6_9BURK|nr:ABC-type transport auxiliary lipoprotein family protein [Undibacterium griseum]MBC3883930.1 membrane integrity-associated transporter subunit PqiC [Undibacterium griseum]
MSLSHLGHGVIAFFFGGLLMLLGGCAGTVTAPKQSYDFGAFQQAAVPDTRLQVILAEIQTTPALDSNAMLYRLNYANGQQLQPYAQARWSMPPAQLLAQRLRQQFAARGSLLGSPADGVDNLPLLHLELQEFSQIFTAPERSHAQLSLHAVLVKNRRIIAQGNFVRQTPSATQDAAGGAQAMQQAADRLSTDLLDWLNSQLHP